MKRIFHDNDYNSQDARSETMNSSRLEKKRFSDEFLWNMLGQVCKEPKAKLVFYHELPRNSFSSILLLCI